MNRFLSVGVLVAMALGTAGRAIADVDPSMVGWWKLDDGSGSTALDSSGRGRDGTLYGDPLWIQGYLGGALQFDGMNDYVDTQYSENLPRWTVSAWVRSPRAPRQGSVGGPVHREANYQFNWNHDDSRFRGTAALLIGDTWYPAHFGALLANQWYHLAATFDGMSLKAYVNGVLTEANPAAQGVPSWDGNSLKIGRHAGGPWYFTGTVDDVRIYNRPLTDAEIQGVMERYPLLAWNPKPAQEGNLSIADANALSWSAADNAVQHDVYFGADPNAVKYAGMTSPLYWGRQTGTSFPIAGLVESGGRYFWRIDEVEADGVTVHKGAIWSFTVSAQLIVDDFEAYTDEQGSLVSDTWADGRINGTCAQIGDGAERDNVHGGAQAMSLAYGNAGAPFYSEIERQFAPPQDWTAGYMDTLSLWIKGDVASFAQTAPDAYVMSAAGADIWGDNDQFRYAFKRLDGDGSIVARIDSIAFTDVWAKAGVMIRRNLEPGSAHAFMLLTPEGRRAFQNRPVDGSSACFSAHSLPGAVTLPYWVKLERRGNQFTGYYSPNGVKWIRQPDTENPEADVSPNPQTIDMPSSVWIGLALTSHAEGTATRAAFSAVKMTGYISGDWKVAQIGADQPGNSPDDLYVIVEDSNGVAASVVNPDPAAVTAPDWTEWRVPLSSFTGVDLSEIAMLRIGVGGRESPIPIGDGRIYLDDIRVWKP